MDAEDIFPFIAIAAVVGLGLAAKAIIDARQAVDRLASLTERFYMLDHRLARLAEQMQTGAPPVPPSAEAAAGAEPEPVPLAATAAPEPQEQPPTLPEPALALEAAPESPAAPQRTPPWQGWEQVFVEHWLVWLGGATLALGGAFLVKLSIDYGLLVPAVRVAFGVALGIGLSIGGEWLLRHEPTESLDPRFASYVPQALAAAGAAIVFASLYAAYALYALVPSSVAFVLLAATAVAAAGQSLRQGPFVAALGLIGSYAVPALVSSDAPHALPLFAYLTTVTAGSLLLLRYREWWWLAWLTLTGAVGWALLWLGVAADPETPVVALYLLVLLAMFGVFRMGIEQISLLAGKADTAVVAMLTRCACWAIGVALFALAHTDGFGDLSIATAAIAVIGLMALAYLDRDLDDVIAAAGLLPLALLATWNLPLTQPQIDFLVFRVEPDRVAQFSAAALGFALLLGLGGFLLLPKVARPGRWAALSAAVPPVVLAIAYWRLQKFDLNIGWTLAALSVAVLELGAAATAGKRRDGGIEYEIALASYAVGVLAGTIFAATLALSEAWLTVALALHLPAMGWIENRIRLPALRWLALGVAAAAVIRLVLNPYVLDYPLGPTPVVNWLLYGYGVPAAAFIVATRQFGSSKDDALVWVLEAGSALFLLALLTLELVHAIFGRLSLWKLLDDFTAGSAMISLWLAFAAGMLKLGEQRNRPVLRWGGVVVCAIATAFAVVWQPLSLVFGVRVGELIIFDGLILAYALPAVLYGLIAWLLRARRVLPVIARMLAAGAAFMWVTLEINHVYNGKVVLFGSTTEAEWYTYSVAWLAFAAGAFGYGLVRSNDWLRRIGLAGLVLVIGKVFLSDMAELRGILRALSFIGLGGSLVALGYAYRRLRPLPPPAAQPEAPA